MVFNETSKLESITVQGGRWETDDYYYYCRRRLLFRLLFPLLSEYRAINESARRSALIAIASSPIPMQQNSRRNR
jgi:hypothetical protein